MIIKKCPNRKCNNNIRISEVRFPVINDFGGILVKCDKCAQLAYTLSINPVETAILSGAEKIEVWDDEIHNKEKFLENYSNALELEPGILVKGDFESREYKFNFSEPHIYFCSQCGSEVETSAKSALDREKELICSEFDNLMNFVLANSGFDHDDLLIEAEGDCACGKRFTSYWHYNFVANKSPLDVDKLNFIGTDMPINSQYIDGIMSKNSCKTILEKFILRWNSIYPKSLIVTPFVGHQFLTKEDTIELWDWIKNFLDPKKSTLVTRTATYRKYVKACMDSGIDVSLLENYGLNNPVIQDFTKKQDFHAKIYVGYSEYEAEILMGSFNLMNGPSVENIAYKKMDYSLFNKKFIAPMKISLDEPGKTENTWLHMKKKEDQWIGWTVDVTNIFK